LDNVVYRIGLASGVGCAEQRITSRNTPTKGWLALDLIPLSEYRIITLDVNFGVIANIGCFLTRISRLTKT